MSLPIHFAPLQGYTDRVYREAHARVFGGIDTYYTPFVRIEKGGFRKKELRDIALSDNQSAHVVPQLIAATADEFRRIASLFREQGYREADVNLGCPFPMQVRQHRGAGILPFADEVASLLRAVGEFPDMQFSVKMRLGWVSPDEALTLLPLLNDLPFTHITLHPRIGTQQYKGNVDMEGFARFEAVCTKPLVYNGDLNSEADIQAVAGRFTRLHGVMMGRGLLATPWLAAQYVAGKELPVAEKRQALHLFHSCLMEGYMAYLEGGEHQVLAKLQTVWEYLLPDAEKRLRKKVLKSTSLPAYRQAVKEVIDEGFIFQ